MKKTIIFDLGGVLIDWNPKYMYRKIFETEKSVDHFLQHVCTFEWNEAQDGGRTIAEANQILIDQFPEYQSEILAFYGRWTEMLGGPIVGTVDILRQISRSTSSRLVALTNWSAETWPHAIERYDFLQLFEGILVSGQEGLKKPDPAIYHLILSRYDIKPQDAVFIDDNLRNIEAAKAIGIQSILFVSPDQLAADLQSLDLL